MNRPVSGHAVQKFFTHDDYFRYPLLVWGLHGSIAVAGAAGLIAQSLFLNGAGDVHGFPASPFCTGIWVAGLCLFYAFQGMELLRKPPQPESLKVLP